MKILYLSDVNIDRTSGVLTKINHQIEYWTNSGHEVYFISIENFKTNFKNILLTKKVTDFLVIQQLALRRIVKEGASHGFLNGTLGQNKILKYCKKILPDLIYLRELLPFPGIQKTLNFFPAILEANTLLKEELKLASGKARLAQKQFSELIYLNINGFIGVTDEIKQQFTKYKKPLITISNGIDLKNVAGRKTLSNYRGQPNIVFVGSPNQAWQGVDKFVLLAKNCPEFNFHLIGMKIPENLPNLIQYGYLSQNELDEIYPKMDIGIGTLAAFRKNLNEACPLKVRAYLSKGLPVVIAYFDKDLTNQDFVLKIENSEESIINNLLKIKEFILQKKEIIVSEETVRPLISSEIKEKERLTFFEMIIQNRKK